MTFTPSPLLAIATFILAGATLKLADQTGEDRNSRAGYLSAILAGVLLGSIIGYGPEESSIVIGIVVGVSLARKIDRPNLLLGLLVTVATAYILGFEMPLVWLLALVSILSLVDEVGHDRLGGKTGSLSVFFRYRVSLKVALLFAAAASIVSATAAIGFLGFDGAYDATNWLLSRKNKAI
jgi:hypothetical protein